MSHIDQEKKRRKGSKATSKWTLEFQAQPLDSKEVKEMVDRLSAEIQDMEAAIKKPRKAAGKGQAEQTLLRRALKRAIPVKNKSDRKKAMESPIYKELGVKRDENRVGRKNLLEMENKLRAKRRELYYYSKLNDVPEKSKIYKVPATTPSNATVFRTNPTWNHFTGEEAVEHLDIKDLIQNCRNGERTVVFAGTDYGLCKMSETIALTRTQLEEHINYYSILLGKYFFYQRYAQAKLKYRCDSNMTIL